MQGELFWRMNTSANQPDTTTGEKHVPVITVDGKIGKGEKVKVHVSVGGGKHPNLNEHHIQWVELRCNDLYIGRAEFAPVIMTPEVTFEVVLPGGDYSLSAVARCNLHGLWVGVFQSAKGCCG